MPGAKPVISISCPSSALVIGVTVSDRNPLQGRVAVPIHFRLVLVHEIAAVQVDQTEGRLSEKRGVTIFVLRQVAVICSRRNRASSEIAATRDSSALSTSGYVNGKRLRL